MADPNYSEPAGEVRLSSTPSKWVNDWDLLSPKFQAEATVYIQVVAVFVVIFLLKKRGRLFQGITLFGALGRKQSDRRSERNGQPNAAVEVPSEFAAHSPSPDASQAAREVSP